MRPTEIFVAKVKVKEYLGKFWRRKKLGNFQKPEKNVENILEKFRRA